MYHLWEEARLGPLTLRNRTVRSATNEHLSEADGQLTEIWVDTITELAKNEVGLIISGHFTVDRNFRADEAQPVIDEQTNLELLRSAADRVHSCGGSMVLQLSHSGLKAPETVNGRPTKGPNDFSILELDALVERFVTAAKLCQRAGLDGVQIHSAHGYLLSSFLNPAENQRKDEYGGCLEHRSALLRRILSSVRDACGSQFALLVKIDSNGSGNLHRLLELLQEIGIDGAEISGLDFSSRAGEKKPFYLDALMDAKTGINIPLILVGGIFSRKSAEQVLAAGIPFAAFSRSLICQPDFIAQLKRAAAEESACLACNGCYGIYRRRPVRCVQHSVPVAQLSKIFGC